MFPQNMCRFTAVDNCRFDKSRFFIFNTILRAKRAYLVQVTIVKAIIALIRLPPRIPAIAMASIIPGKEIIISEIRIITVSTLPPK